MVVIGLCGLTGAGKDAFAGVLSGHPVHARRYKHSDILRHMLEENERPVQAARMSALFEAMAGQLGYAWLARRIVAKVRADVFPDREHESPRIIVGIRNTEEVEHYRRTFGSDFVLVAVEANEDLRFERVRNRGERPEEHDMSREAFAALGQLGANTGEAAVIALADTIITNEGTREDLATAIERMLD